MDLLRYLFQDGLSSKIYGHQVHKTYLNHFISLWKYLQERVCQDNASTVEHLHNNITHDVQGITADVLRCVSRNVSPSVIMFPGKRWTLPAPPVIYICIHNQNK